jgi:hypothetical protein
MSKLKNVRQGSLFDIAKPAPMFEYFIEDESERVKAQATFIIERHKIFLKKAAGRPKPWTNDPILQTGKFTNIYRELDPGTTWIKDNIIDPYEDHPDLWFMLCIARLINWPDTLQEMMDEDVWPDKGWNADKVFKILWARWKRPAKLITGAYIVNSVFPAGYDKKEGSKARYIPYLGLDPLWQNRKNLRPMFRSTMVEAVAAITSHRGWGPFLANQAVVDLTYSKKWLGRASDLNTFTSPGPGTCKGMNWMITGRMNGGIAGKKLNEHMIRFRNQVNAEIKSRVPTAYWTCDFRTGFAPISMPNYSNCNCETSKMIRSIQDGGAGMKNKYNGRP